MDKIIWILVLVSIVFVLLFLFGAYISLYRARKRLILEKHHDDIVEENIAVLYSKYLKNQDKKVESFSSFVDRKKKNKKIRNVFLDIFLGFISLVLIAVIAASIAYRFTGGQVYINNTTFYVVETDSMSEKNLSHEDELAGHDDQIEARTFILLEKLSDDEELVPYTIYAYKDEDDQIIVHRYIETLDDGTYLFRGDSNALPTQDDNGVTRDQIIGRFTGYQNHALGETIYFLKSPVGIFVLFGLFAILLGEGIYSDKLDKLYKQRYEILLPYAQGIYNKYVIIDGDRNVKPLLIKGIASYEPGSIYYVLHGNNMLSTGEKVVIIKEEEHTCLCSVLSDVDEYDATPIRVSKDNLSFYSFKK